MEWMPQLYSRKKQGLKKYMLIKPDWSGQAYGFRIAACKEITYQHCLTREYPCCPKVSQLM